MLHLEHLSLTTCTSYDDVTTFLSEDGVQLINPLERINWTHNPVQLVPCSCGSEGCDRTHYVHLSRLGELVLWTLPHDEACLNILAHPVLKAHGAVCIAQNMWTYMSELHPGVPSFEVLTPMTWEALKFAWLEPLLEQGQDLPIEHLTAHLEEQLLACDTLDNDEALALMEHHISRMEQDPHTPVQGRLVPIKDHDAKIEVAYLGTPSWIDVPLFALYQGTPRLMVGRDWMLIEE